MTGGVNRKESVLAGHFDFVIPGVQEPRFRYPFLTHLREEKLTRRKTQDSSLQEKAKQMKLYEFSRCRTGGCD